ncbi:MAG: glycerate kinase [Actinomycetota bacterium]|nr:glycerate kinase [Actinomycetota bacterium]
MNISSSESLASFNVKVLLLFDKFRGTLSAREAIEIVTSTAPEWAEIKGIGLSDGGEGLLEAIATERYTTSVHGPLGEKIIAEFGSSIDGSAIIEMSKASGLTLVGGKDSNDPIAASTIGTGELIKVAIERGYRSVVVGCGGSATTDGGLGAFEVLRNLRGFERVDVTCLYDVETTFLDAATDFAPQKGATSKQVQFLRRRLMGTAQIYQGVYGISPVDVPGSGAAGGLAGFLHCAGASLVRGFDYVAEALNLERHILECDVVVTGEGLLDEESFNGKVVGEVVKLARSASKPIFILCGDSEITPGSRFLEGLASPVTLKELVGIERSLNEPYSSLALAVDELFNREISHYRQN